MGARGGTGERIGHAGPSVRAGTALGPARSASAESAKPLVFVVASGRAERVRVAESLDEVGVLVIAETVDALRELLLDNVVDTLGPDPEAVGPSAPTCDADRPSPRLRSVSEGGTANDGAADPGSIPERLEVDGLCIDDGRQEVSWRGKIVPLTYREREILRWLASELGRVWSYADLHKAVWQTDYLGDGGDLHSAVKRLRRKLDNGGVGFGVEAVRGVGLRLAPVPD